jgi:tetratricopeptide (TPR) repeat protein
MKGRFSYLPITAAVLVAAVWATGQLSRYATADIYASVGRKKAKAGDHATAQEYLYASLKYAPDEADNWLAYAEFVYTAARAAKTKAAALHLLKQAQEAYEKSIQLNPLEGNAWLGLGYTRWWLSKFEGFENEYEGVETSLIRALSTDPNNGEFLYAVAGYYLSEGEIEKGLGYVERLASTFPNTYRYIRKTNYWSDEVRESFKNGLKSASANRRAGMTALTVLASIAADEEDWHSAVSYTEDIINRFNTENSPGPHLLLGYYCLKLGRQEEAKAAFLKALRFSSEPERTLNDLLRSHKQANALDTYINLCKEVSKFNESVRRSLSLFSGKAHFYNNDLELAEENLRRYLKIQESAEAHFYLAEIAFRKKDWDAAELESQRATFLEPEKNHYHYLFARSLQAQKKFDSALKAIDEAIHHATSPRHYYHNMRGWLHWSMGNYQLAAHDWEKGFEIAPKNANYPAQIAMAYKNLEDYGEAERYYLAAIKLDPQNNEFKQEIESIRKLK